MCIPHCPARVFSIAADGSIIYSQLDSIVHQFRELSLDQTSQSAVLVLSARGRLAWCRLRVTSLRPESGLSGPAKRNKCIYYHKFYYINHAAGTLAQIRKHKR